MLSQSRWKNKTFLVMRFQREGALRLQRGLMDVSRDLGVQENKGGFSGGKNC